VFAGVQKEEGIGFFLFPILLNKAGCVSSPEPTHLTLFVFLGEIQERERCSG
jgi:hypothetical protein